jgi:glycosyltransferase involved in cell wall biosynthesis
MVNNTTIAAPGMSVVICCYNSVARLQATLQHLAAQVVPPDLPWEIIVVDNASTDETGTFALATWKALDADHISFTVVTEPVAGQQYARKKGVAMAFYEYLIFCDDDNWLGPDYVAVAYEVMANKLHTGAAGGQNIPVSDVGTYPDWFEAYRDYYAIGIPAPASGDVTHRGFVLGAGLVTRRSLFQEMYHERYPSLLNGRNGEVLTTGDDFEYCKRLLLRGYTLYYDDRMTLEHFIPKERLTIPYRERLLEGILQAGLVLNEYDHALRLRAKNKRKSRTRLVLLAPFRIMLTRWGLLNRKLQDEQLTLFYLSPFVWHADRVRLQIKRFMYQQ